MKVRNIWNRIINKRPQVFIVCGGRRTGTTLLAAILCSDPRANPLGQECQILTRLLEAQRWGAQNFEDFGRSFFSGISQYNAFFTGFAKAFVNEVSSFASPGGILILKNPELSRVIQSAVCLFPDAHLIATLRDPRDQIAAELEVTSKRISMNLSTEKLDSASLIDRLISTYKDYYKEILVLHESHKIKIIRYEDLVADPHETIRKLQEWTKLKLSFNPNEPWPRVSALAGLKTPSPSSSIHYGQPITSHSVGRYKNELNFDQILQIEQTCRDFMSKMGYGFELLGQK